MPHHIQVPLYQLADIGMQDLDGHGPLTERTNVYLGGASGAEDAAVLTDAAAAAAVVPHDDQPAVYKRRKLVSVSAVGGFVLIYDIMGDKEIAS